MSSEYTPKVIGVTSYVLFMSEIEELMLKFSTLRVDIKDNIGGMLDSRGVDGSEFHTNKILDAIR